MKKMNRKQRREQQRKEQAKMQTDWRKMLCSDIKTTIQAPPCGSITKK
jgi:hypothetical protein